MLTIRKFAPEEMLPSSCRTLHGLWLCGPGQKLPLTSTPQFPLSPDPTSMVSSPWHFRFLRPSGLCTGKWFVSCSCISFSRHFKVIFPCSSKACTISPSYFCFCIERMGLLASPSFIENEVCVDSVSCSPCHLRVNFKRRGTAISLSHHLKTTRIHEVGIKSVVSLH